MYRIFRSLFLLLILPAMAVPQVGYLSVNSPENTTIYLDSVLIARQPFSDLALLPGKYKLGSDPVNDFSWQRRIQAQEIEIKPFEKTVVDLKKTGSIVIYSDPIGSDVFGGGKYLGKTPLYLGRLAVNGEDFRIKRAGYEEKKFSLAPDQNEYTVKLLPIDPGAEMRVQEALLGGTEVNWFKESLVLTSFVSSWAAFFFKRKADNLYLQYQGAAIPSRIDYFYNETEKYDRYSEVALGVSAVSLGVYLFILMTE